MLTVAVLALLGLAVFVVTLVVITLASAWAADVAGVFRLLFITRPYKLLFRMARWVLALLATVSVVMFAVE